MTPRCGRKSRAVHAWRWALSFWLAAACAMAHEVPASVVVRAFVKPEVGTLHVLVRVPLEAMRDVDFPLRGPGYLDLAAADSSLREAARLWLAGEISVHENGRPLPTPRVTAVRVSLPSSTAFAAYPSALAHLRAPPLPAQTELYWQQALVDVLLDYDIDAADAEFTIAPGFGRLGVHTETVLHFLPPGGPERVYRFVGDPGRVALDPRWYAAAARFVGQGFRHVLGGADHLLFVFCLVIPFRRLKPLVVLVTAFTVAHSITLTAAALGMAPQVGWFPPLVETAIAASVLYLALENLLAPSLERRWMLAFGFGLVHGLGFASALAHSLQFAGSHLAVAVASFNVGIELGQLMAVAASLALITGLFRVGLPERFGFILLSVAVAHTAWHWLLDRGSVVLAYPFTWPAMTAAWWAAAIRWAMVADGGGNGAVAAAARLSSLGTCRPGIR